VAVFFSGPSSKRLWSPLAQDEFGVQASCHISRGESAHLSGSLILFRA